MPLSAFLRDSLGFLAFVFRRWREDRCPHVAASLTFTTLLALVPLFTVVVALLSSMPFFGAVMVQIRSFLRMSLVPEIAERIISVHMVQFAEAAGQLTAVSLAALFAMTIATLYTIDRSLNLIWRADRHRPLLRSVAGYTLLLVTGPVLLGASLWVTTWLVAASRAEGAALGLVPVAVSTLGFFLTYRFIPNRHVPGAHALAGGFLAAVVFELTKLLFASWIRAVPTYRLVYGAFAAIPLFLLWLYLTWLVVLAGAEFTAALGYWRLRLWRQRDSLAERLRGALAVVRRLPPPGGVPVPITDLRAAIDMPGDRIEDVLHRLADAGVAHRTRKGWCLLKPLTEVPLVVVYHAAQPGAVTLSPQEWSRCSPELGVIALSMEAALKRSVAELP